MNYSLDNIKAISSKIKEKNNKLLDELLNLESSLNESLNDIEIYAKSCDIELETFFDDQRVYGYISYSDGELNICHRSVEDDICDAMQKVPEEYQGFSIKKLSNCSPAWLLKASEEKVISSLLENINDGLKFLNNHLDLSLKIITNLLNSESQELDNDMKSLLHESKEEYLLDKWIKARETITTNPSDSVSRSSSYIESVCRVIL